MSSDTDRGITTLLAIGMAEEKNDQERTEEPSQRKLDKAREEGNVSISREISSVMLMLCSLVVFLAAGGYMYNKMRSLFTTFFYNAGMELADQDHAMEFLRMAMVFGIDMLMPIMIFLFVTALLVNLAQTGGAFSTQALEPKPDRLNPISGFKRIFSAKGLVELTKGFMKLFIVGLVVYFTIRSEIDRFVSFVVMPMENALAETGRYVLLVVSRILGALFLLSIADAVWQRYQHHKELRMTKQEVKDEHKQMEGDPHVKAQRRKFGLTLVRRKRLDHAIMESDVVVTNPIHYAIALKYDPGVQEAPVVMAKGQRLKALKIREIAEQYGIPIVENRPVAQALFATAEEDEPIPVDLYRAVAEILAYIYKLKNKQK